MPELENEEVGEVLEMSEEELEKVPASTKELLEEEAEEEEVEEDEEEDPWAWTKDEDPAKVRKTWDKFTQEREALIKESDELKPLRELQQDLQNDPELAKYIRGYYDTKAEGVTPAEKFEKLEQRMDVMQRNTAIERELETLHVEIKKLGWPEFDNTELLAHASEKNAGSLMMAYKDKFMDQILDANETTVTDGIKKNAEKGVVRKPKSAKGVKGAKPKGLNELEDMDDDEFKEFVKNKGK